MICLLPSDDPALVAATDLAVARSHVAAAIAGPPDHETARADILGFIDSHPDALHRRCVEGHLTGSAMVVDPVSRRFLFMLHAKLGLWLQPGGHADGDAALPGVALREATEETGIGGLQVAVPAIDLDIHRVEPPGEPSHLHHDVRYLVLARPGAEPAGNHESRELRWAGPDDGFAGLDLDHGTVRMAHTALDALDALTPR